MHAPRRRRHRRRLRRLGCHPTSPPTGPPTTGTPFAVGGATGGDSARRYEESGRLIELLYPLYLEAGVLISCRPVRARDLQAGREALHRAIKREGVPV